MILAVESSFFLNINDGFRFEYKNDKYSSSINLHFAIKKLI